MSLVHPDISIMLSCFSKETVFEVIYHQIKVKFPSIFSLGNTGFSAPTKITVSGMFSFGFAAWLFYLKGITIAGVVCLVMAGYIIYNFIKKLDQRKAIKDKGAQALIPPRKNARWDPKLQERNRGIAERRGLGLDDVGVSLWGKLTGYSKRALVETSFSRLKKIYGGGLCSRKMSSQKVEGHLKCLMLNKMLQGEG